MSTLLSNRKVNVYPRGKEWEVFFRGIDMGGKTTLHYVDNLYIVLKVAGHSAWAGLGREPKYVPASFMVFKVDKDYPPEYDSTQPTTIQLGQLVADFPVRGMKL